MKMMKLALLGGAALAVTAAGARADDLGALKAEIEALNARVAQLETAPAVPAGYQLMTMSSGDATVVPGNADNAKFGSTPSKVTKISVMPTADAPAAATIEWSGYVRAIVSYEHDTSDTAAGASNSADSTDLTARGQLKVVAKTDTSVGEVGVRLNMRGNLDGVGAGDQQKLTGDNKMYLHEAWGWWAMTPELTLGGGYSGSLGNVGYGYDGACTCYGTDNADVAFNPGDTTQLRLTYASGPFSVAAALEDGTPYGAGLGGVDYKNEFGVAGQIKYSGDTVNGAIDAFWRNADWNLAPLTPADNSYGVGAGIGFALGDMANLSVGTQWSHTPTGLDRWGASALASMNLSDAVRAEVGGGYTHYNKNAGDVWAVLAGMYYSPVKQLTIGLEGEYSSANPDGPVKSSFTTVDLVTVFAF